MYSFVARGGEGDSPQLQQITEGPFLCKFYVPLNLLKERPYFCRTARWLQTRQGKSLKRVGEGLMRIKRTSSNRERVSTSGRGIVSSNNPSPSPSSHLPLSPPHPLMLNSLSILREFLSLLPPLCLPFAPKYTHTQRHTLTFSLLMSTSSIPTLPGCLSWLPLYRAHSFITQRRLGRGPEKKRTVWPSEKIQTTSI